MNSSGMKAATSEMLIESTVKPICCAPSIVARSGDMPFSRLRKQFSIITMASSTTKPTETASAISERLSIEKPATHIIAQVPASDSGTVTPAASVAAARRRNTNTTSITSAMVAINVSCMSRTLARIVCVRSDSTEISTPGGIQRLSSGSSL
jgi:ribosomal protein L18